MKKFKINKDFTIKWENWKTNIYLNEKLIQINQLDEHLERLISSIFENLDKFQEIEKYELLYFLLTSAIRTQGSDTSIISIFAPHIQFILDNFQLISTELNIISWYFNTYIKIFYKYDVKDTNLIFLLESLERYEECFGSKTLISAISGPIWIDNVDLVRELGYLVNPFLKFIHYLINFKVEFFQKNYSQIARLFVKILDKIDLLQSERDFLLSLSKSYLPYGSVDHQPSRWTFKEFIKISSCSNKLFEDHYSRIKAQFLKRLNFLDELSFDIHEKVEIFIILIDCIKHSKLLDNEFPILLEFIGKFPIKEQYRTFKKLMLSIKNSEIIGQNMMTIDSIFLKLLNHIKEVPTYKEEGHNYYYYQHLCLCNLVESVERTNLLDSHFIELLNATSSLKLETSRFTTLKEVIKAIERTNLLDSHFIELLNATSSLKLETSRFTTLKEVIKATKGTDLSRIHFLPLLKKISSLSQHRDKSESISHLNNTLIDHVNLGETEYKEALSYIEEICTGSDDQLLKARFYALMGVPEERMKMDFKFLNALSKDGDLNAKSKLRESLVTLANQGHIDELRSNFSHIKYFMEEEGDDFLTYLIEQLGSDYRNPHRDFERELWDDIGLLDLLSEVKENLDWYGLRILAGEKFEHYLSLAIKKGGPTTLEPILQFLSTKLPNEKDPKDVYDIYEYIDDIIGNRKEKYYKDLNDAKKVVIDFVKKNPISSNLESYKYIYFNFVRHFLEDDFWEVIEIGDKLLELAQIWYEEPKYYDIGYDNGDDYGTYNRLEVGILIEKNQITELYLNFDQSHSLIEDYNVTFGGKDEDIKRLIEGLSTIRKVYVNALLRLDQVDPEYPRSVEFFQFLVTLKTLRTMFEELKQNGLEIEYLEL